MAATFTDPRSVMARAIEIAARGIGRVEPNPAVGAVIVDARLNLIAEGWHEEFGRPHAEINALRLAGPLPDGATLFVTLEPCCHFGKTPPCTSALIDAGVKHVVIGMPDAAPHVAGDGIAALQQAGIKTEVGVLQDQIRRLNAPFFKLVTSGMPYVHAKWAMTLDGKIASRNGHSKWISNSTSRAIVHGLRGRMDGILIGLGTAVADDPLLTARPAGPRIAARIILDSQARLPMNAQLVQTAKQAPVILITTESAPEQNTRALNKAGLEVMRLPAKPSCDRASDSNLGRPDLVQLLAELGKRQFTNLLVEGGSAILGAFFDESLVDEVHVFIAPKLIGGESAKSPISGLGQETIPDFPQLQHCQVQDCQGDLYIHGAFSKSSGSIGAGDPDRRGRH